ncbi:acyltransferase family protein [Sphingomonas sp. AX6]|uniref:acyltransferase family protein n=1 Tax=Sphingomonas sp. AX6 TaxID=2653171 RepID=UPI00135BB002|nr:acyltransferase [Sphingomonas sp. AX6]
MQALRGVAAAAVVVHHAILISIHRYPDDAKSAQIIPSQWAIELGSIGVDIFFILSGFLMVWISEPYLKQKKTVTHFFRQRVLRIWPMYAIVTIVTLIPISLVYIQTGVRPFDLQLYRVMGILFWPSFSEYGHLQPIVVVGWTLIYEIVFYACFAIALLIRKGSLLLNLSLIIAFLYITSSFGSSVWSELFGNDLLFEFLIGASIGALACSSNPARHRVITLMAFAMVLGSFAAHLTGSENRVLLFGLPAGAIFLAFLTLENKIFWPQWIKVLGDASYSIYLTHMIVMYLVTVPVALWLSIYMPSSWSIILVSAISFLLSIIVGVSAYFLMEDPVTKFLKGGRSKLAITNIRRSAKMSKKSSV